MSYLATPLAAAAPAPAVEAAPNYAATVAAASAAPVSTASWFTDPSQGLITGWPNFLLLFGGFAIVMLIKGRGR